MEGIAFEFDSPAHLRRIRKGDRFLCRLAVIFVFKLVTVG